MPNIEPLTVERWTDFERLFGPNGACGGCWCMWWRVSAKELGAGNDVNRERMRALVAEKPTGLLAYDDEGVPVGWCSLGPRSEFGRIQRSRDLAAPVDDGVALWSIVCFYIATGRRRKGIGRALLDAAVEYATANGGHGRHVRRCGLRTGAPGQAHQSHRHASIGGRPWLSRRAASSTTSPLRRQPTALSVYVP